MALEIINKLQYEECEYCGACELEITSCLLWEGDMIVGQEAEVLCKNRMTCFDIRMAMRGDHTLQDPKKVKKVFRRSERG